MFHYPDLSLPQNLFCFDNVKMAGWSGPLYGVLETFLCPNQQTGKNMGINRSETRLSSGRQRLLRFLRIFLVARTGNRFRHETASTSQRRGTHHQEDRTRRRACAMDKNETLPKGIVKRTMGCHPLRPESAPRLVYRGYSRI